MSKLNWLQMPIAEKVVIRVAVADNGMKAVIWSDDAVVFAFPGVLIEYGNLQKVPKNVRFVDRESAESWCEEEIDQWKPIPQ
jgi:hypothetical protein